MDHSPVSDGEDNINLSRLFKKEATLVSDINGSDDGRETIFNKPVKGKSPNKNDKVKRTPERKRKNEDDIERGGCYLCILQIYKLSCTLTVMFIHETKKGSS